MANNKDCPHNHNSPLAPGHDFDANYTTKCGHGCGYSERDLINELIRQNEQLKSKSNQRKRTLHNHKTRWQQAKKLLKECYEIIDSDTYNGKTEILNKLEKVLGINK